MIASTEAARVVGTLPNGGGSAGSTEVAEGDGNGDSPGLGVVAALGASLAALGLRRLRR